MSHLQTQREMHRFKWMKALHQFRLTTYLMLSNYNYLYLMLLTDNLFKYTWQGFIVSKAFLCCSTRLPVSVHKCRFYGQMFKYDTQTIVTAMAAVHISLFWGISALICNMYARWGDTQTPAICIYHQIIHCNKRQQPLQQPATSHSSSSYSATTSHFPFVCLYTATTDNNHCNNQPPSIRLFIHCNNRQQPLQQPATSHSSVYTLQQPTTTTATTSHLPLICSYTATTDNIKDIQVGDL